MRRLLSVFFAFSFLAVLTPAGVDARILNPLSANQLGDYPGIFAPSSLSPADPTLDGFESISGTLAEYTSSGYVWYQNSTQGSGLGITTSSSNVTQGSFSWRWQGTSLNGGFSSWAYDATSDYVTGVDLSGFDSIKLDVFGATVPASLSFFILVEDLTDFNLVEDDTADGFSGADTLVVDLSGFTPTQKANCNIRIGISNNNGPVTSDFDIYIDNLRGE